MKGVVKPSYKGLKAGRSTPCFYTFVIILSMIVFMGAGVAHAVVAHRSAIEAKIIWFIKDLYPDKGDSIRVKLNSLPSALKENTKVLNISFLKVPDAGGDGICSVEIRSQAGHSQVVQVPFKVSVKRELYILKQSAQKGDIITRKDVIVRDTYMNGKMAGYPATMEDVVGKALKRDLPANTILTDQALEEQVVLKRGEIVTIIAESNKLLVQAKGRAIDKGRMGETVRVKNLSSGKELVGKVVSGTAVKVEF